MNTEWNFYPGSEENIVVQQIYTRVTKKLSLDVILQEIIFKCDPSSYLETRRACKQAGALALSGAYWTENSLNAYARRLKVRIGPVIHSPAGQQPNAAAGARLRARLSASPSGSSESHSRTPGLHCSSQPCLFLSLLFWAPQFSQDARERTLTWVT